jgi:hypothetical protein
VQVRLELLFGQIVPAVKGCPVTVHEPLLSSALRGSRS